MFEQKIKKHILCSIIFPENNAGCELIWKIKYGSDRKATDDNVTRHMRFACWITMAKDTHSKFVILITFLWQKWLRERTSILMLYVYCPSYSYSAYLT